MTQVDLNCYGAKSTNGLQLVPFKVDAPLPPCLLPWRTDLESFSCAVELKKLQVTDCSVLLHKCLNNDIKILRQELQLINYNPGIIYQLN